MSEVTQRTYAFRPIHKDNLETSQKNIMVMNSLTQNGPYFLFWWSFSSLCSESTPKVCHLDLKAISLIFRWLKYDKWNLPAAIPLNWPASDSSECCTFPIGNPLSLAFRQFMLSKNDMEADRIIRKSQKDLRLLECHFQRMNMLLLFALEFTSFPSKSGAHVLGILVFFQLVT